MWYAVALIGIIAIASIAIRHYGLVDWLVRQPLSRRATVKWSDLGPVPEASSKFTPQGLTWVNGRLIFANSWKNTLSRVYEFNPDTMQLLRQFDMPTGAVHTSGLAWDGVNLWAVDYISHYAYCFDLERSLADGRAHENGRFKTTLKGTSACCFVPWNGREYLAISDFMNSRNTIFVRHQEALQNGSAAGCIDFAYRNDGFSQGLVFAHGRLFESENKRGVDVVNEIDLELLAQTRSSRRSTMRQFNAPDCGVEDLAWDGENMWTSDEVVFRFFRTSEMIAQSQAP